MEEDKSQPMECTEFNNFFKKAESIIKRAEEYRLKQQSDIHNTELSENLKDDSEGRSPSIQSDSPVKKRYRGGRTEVS